jgi:hypothetical protein
MADAGRFGGFFLERLFRDCAGLPIQLHLCA